MLSSMTSVISQTYLAPLSSDVEQVLRPLQTLRSAQPCLPHPATSQLASSVAVSSHGCTVPHPTPEPIVLRPPGKPWQGSITGNRFSDDQEMVIRASVSRRVFLGFDVSQGCLSCPGYIRFIQRTRCNHALRAVADTCLCSHHCEFYYLIS